MPGLSENVWIHFSSD